MGTNQIKEWQRRIGVLNDGIFGDVTLEKSIAMLESCQPKPPEVPKPPQPPITNFYSVKGGLLYNRHESVLWKGSPNYREGNEPSLIVIHYTGDNGTGGLQWLCDPNSSVSAHLWISKTVVVWQLVNFNDIAWHAGLSSWNGESVGNSVNSFSIGIELQGTGDFWPEAQIMTCRLVVEALRKAYPDITDVVGHCDVAPGRKVDPGPRFPWDKVR